LMFSTSISMTQKRYYFCSRKLKSYLTYSGTSLWRHGVDNLSFRGSFTSNYENI
jgi:hypothetical protein